MAPWQPLHSYDVIQFEMALDDAQPTYEEIVRWCGRFPQYRHQITEKFVSDAIHKIEEGEPQELIVYDEDEIIMAQNLVDWIDQRDYAREVLRRRALELPPRPVRSLERLDRLVLAAVRELRDAGCSENIAPRVSRTAGMAVLPAAVRASLERLEKLGLVFEREDGRFRISIGGKCALAKTAVPRKKPRARMARA